MTRVPPSRVSQPTRPASQAQVQRPRRPKASDKLEKPQKAKGPGGAEDAGEALQSNESQGKQDLTGEHDERSVVDHGEAWAPDSHHELEEKKDTQETARSEAERKDESEKVVRQPPVKKGDDSRGKAQTAGTQKRQADGFERGKEAGRGGTGQAEQLKPSAPVKAAVPVTGPQAAHAAQAAQAVHAVQTAPILPPPSTKPPDAFQLLHQAQEHGVFFKEDQFREGHAEEAEDPDLAAAVEEAIRLLFGVRGILRVGPGRNMENEPVVVVVATQGFGEASLASVPPAVNRFPTLLAVPFDLLPLKKER